MVDLPTCRIQTTRMTHTLMACLSGYAALALGFCLPSARGAEPSLPPTCAVEIAAGTSLFCPPLPSAGRLDGALGQQLAGVVDAIILRSPGTTNIVQLHLDPNRAWVDQSNTPYTRPLEPGQGCIITRQAKTPATLVFTGVVVSAPSPSITLAEGVSIVGFPSGQATAMSTAFETPLTGRPVASFDETEADIMAFLNADGSWRRLLRLTDQAWYDARTLTNTTLVLQPGQAIYYHRQPGHGPLRISF